jgi:uncharacterized membrane protein
VYRVLGLDSSRPGGLAAMRAGRSHRLEEAVTLQCPVGAVERQLRRLEEVPRWLPRAEAVEEIGTRSRWAVKTRDGALVGWDVEIESDAPGRIAWRSVDRSPHPVQGEFLLRSASGGRATELTVSIEHRVALAPRVEEALREELREGLRRFKQLVEAGEIATTRGQPCGRAEMRGGVGR